MVEYLRGNHRANQDNQQRTYGDAKVVMNFNGRVKGQHANKVHGPNTACQATCTEPAPYCFGFGLFCISRAFNHV